MYKKENTPTRNGYMEREEANEFVHVKGNVDDFGKTKPLLKEIKQETQIFDWLITINLYKYRV
jgi:hypothetical protein